MAITPLLHHFTLPSLQNHERALRATADFVGLTVSLNGKPVIELDPYDPPAETDVSRLIAKGENTIIARATGVAGPSALAVSLEIVRKGASPIMVMSDADWKGSLRSHGVADPCGYPALFIRGRRKATNSDRETSHGHQRPVEEVNEVTAKRKFRVIRLQ